MRRALIAAVLLLLGSHAWAYDYWNDIRYSALLPDSTMIIRTENVYGAGISNYALYNEGGVQEAEMAPIIDGASTVSAAVPGPLAGTRYYGFRTLQSGSIDLMPVRIPDGTDPAPEDLTRIASDPLGDELFGYPNLDILDCRMSYSGDRLYGCLTNAGGGFPVIQGLTFFGYTIAINQPGVADPDTVLGLMYTYEQAGIISPGLYLITGTGLGDLTKLGEIEVEEFPASNSLVISCDFADLLSNPFFMSWYDPLDPHMDVAGFTQRITILGGPAEADQSTGGGCYPRELSISPGTNQIPVLSGFEVVGEGPTAGARIVYSDADSNCPVSAEIVFDDSIPRPMYPLSLDYASPVTYATESGIEPLASGSWTSAVVYFSDNLADTAEYVAPQVGVPAVRDGYEREGLWAYVCPNPSGGDVTVGFAMQAPRAVSIEVYDIRGALVRRLADGGVPAASGMLRWTGIDGSGLPVSPGIYFVRVAAMGREMVLKVVIVD